MSRSFILVPIVLLALFAGAITGIYFRSRQPGPMQGREAIVPGEFVPAFELPRLLDTTSIFNPAKLQGEVYLLNFWASWCAGCKKEHPFLMELAESKEVVLYSVNYLDDLQKARAVLQNSGNPYRASAYDAGAYTGPGYGIVGTPITFVVDREGRMQHKHLGPLNRKIYEQEIRPLLQKLADKQA